MPQNTRRHEKVYFVAPPVASRGRRAPPFWARCCILFRMAGTGSFSVTLDRYYCECFRPPQARDVVPDTRPKGPKLRLGNSRFSSSPRSTTFARPFFFDAHDVMKKEALGVIMVSALYAAFSSSTPGQRLWTPNKTLQN